MKSQRLKSYLEVLVLCVAICLVWGIVMVPVILFLVPPSPKVSLSNGINNNTNKTCLEPLSLSPESSGKCFLALANTLIDSNCQESDVFVLRNMDSTAKSLIGGLDLLGASAECREEVVPFLCLHLFGLCSGSGVSIQPTSTQCQQIRDMSCRNEWMVALSLDTDLPDCDKFPSESTSCTGTGTNNTSENNRNIQLANLKHSGEILDCRQDFFRETNSSDCIPNCFTWNQYGRMTSIAVDVVTIIAAVIGFFSSIAVIIVSIVRHKSMLTFPSILVIYTAGMDMLPLTFLFLVNYMDRGNLFCSSTNLLKAWIEVTPFCVISGISFSYIYIQGSLWALFYLSTVLWGIRFPFKYRKFVETGNIKYLHFSCLIVGLCLPLLSVIASMANFAVDIKTDPILGNVTFLSGGLGYRPNQFPPILCTVGHPDTTFYSLILPLDISLGVTGTALVLVFYFIYKQSHNDGNKLSVAEKKLLTAFLCFIIVATTASTALALEARDGILGFFALLNYFTCEQRGYDYENPCSRQEFEQYNHPVLFGLASVALGIFPALLLIFTVNIKELKKKKSKASSS